MPIFVGKGREKVMFEKVKGFQVSIIIPTALYAVLIYATRIISNSKNTYFFNGSPIAMTSLTGVFSGLSSLCLIYMVLKYKKLGFIVSLISALSQFPVLIIGIFFRHVYTGMPGLFNNVLALVMVIVIYLYQAKASREHEKLQNLFKQTATALANSIDAKDTYTHGHSARVAEYSKKLAQMNRKSDEECEEIYYAALLHDVGKIGISESIITKKGKLTTEEYEEIKKHPIYGSQILESISEFPYLRIGANGHHERYDGKGYPDGIKGEEIPELARIISVADAYDAMTSKRSYRDPIPQEVVREEIVKGTGTQFDPEYAKLMIQLIDIDKDYKMRECEESEFSFKG